MRNNSSVKLTGDHNECAGCGELFNSTAAFDRHRTGSFGFHGKGVTRRCLTPAEMLAKGMSKNATGWWVTELGGRPRPQESISSLPMTSQEPRKSILGIPASTEAKNGS